MSVQTPEPPVDGASPCVHHFAVHLWLLYDTIDCPTYAVLADQAGAVQVPAGGGVEPLHAPLRPGELLRSCLDTSRARETLGWKPEIELEDGLRTTYEALVEEFKAR